MKLALNPWQPIKRPIDLKHLGKLGEELNECGSAVSRCIIQGMDEAEPVTGKVNRVWLEDEIADVLANVELNIEHFGLDRDRILSRKLTKKTHLRAWHSMLDPLAGRCSEGDRCVCGGDTPGVRAGCCNWIKETL